MRFINRQVVAGNDSTSADLYSEIFEVADFDTLVGTLQIFSANPDTASLTAAFQQASDPSLSSDSWSTLDSITVVAAAGKGKGNVVMSNPERFVRVKLTVPLGAYATAAVDGIARRT